MTISMYDIVDDELPTTQRGLHFAHLNVQSIRNKYDLLKIYVSKLNFDIFSISETWLIECMDNTLLDITGYNFVRLDRSWNTNGQITPIKRGGGVGVYNIRNTLSYSLNNLNVHNNDVKMLWLELHLPHSKNIFLGIIYRPPDGNVIEFCDCLGNTVNDLSLHQNKELLLLGDFKIQYGKTGDPDFMKLLDFEQMTNLSQIVISPTCHNNILDLIYTNSENISISGVLDVFISDHSLIYCTKKKIKQHYEYKTFEWRSYRNYDCVSLQLFLENVDWTTYWSLTNPNDCWSFIYNKKVSCLDNTCPIKGRKNRVNNNPWYDEILECIHEKNRAWKRAKRSKDPDDIATAKRLRNDCKATIRRAKDNFVQDYLENDIISLKKFWEKINYLLPSSSSGNSIQLIDKGNNTLSGVCM